MSHLQPVACKQGLGKSTKVVGLSILMRYFGCLCKVCVWTWSFGSPREAHSNGMANPRMFSNKERTGSAAATDVPISGAAIAFILTFLLQRLVPTKWCDRRVAKVRVHAICDPVCRRQHLLLLASCKVTCMPSNCKQRVYHRKLPNPSGVWAPSALVLH